MNDAPPKKRPWFQLHLSTCVVLMVVAGGLLWFQLHPRKINILMGVLRSEKHFQDGTATGWPVYFSATIDDGSSIGTSPLWFAITINGTCLILTLAATAYTCERVIRRRERKRAAAEG